MVNNFKNVKFNYIKYNRNTNNVSIFYNDFTKFILNKLNIKYLKLEKKSSYVVITSSYALDFFNCILNDDKTVEEFKNKFKTFKNYNFYYKNEIFKLYKYIHSNVPPQIFIKKNETALDLYKSRGSDVGFDIFLTSAVYKKGDIVKYDTGISLDCTIGYYIEMVPRSSLFEKSGYIQTNSVGIIDPNYRGNLMVVLKKLDDSIPEIELPFKYGQLILRQYNLASVSYVKELNKTVRNAEGFGSSG